MVQQGFSAQRLVRYVLFIQGENMKFLWIFCFAALPASTALIFSSTLCAGENADLAQDLANPIADLITMPIQMNYDQNIGSDDDGSKLQTNIQPVIPFTVNDDWNIISRTIVPVIYQEDIFPGAGSQFGLGDVNLTMFFFSKKIGIQWSSLGSRSRSTVSNGHENRTWRRKVGWRPEWSSSQGDRLFDSWRVGQSCLVFCW
jgi:hypothetical protein